MAVQRAPREGKPPQARTRRGRSTPQRGCGSRRIWNLRAAGREPSSARTPWKPFSSVAIPASGERQPGSGRPRKKLTHRPRVARHARRRVIPAERALTRSRTRPASRQTSRILTSRRRTNVKIETSRPRRSQNRYREGRHGNPYRVSLRYHTSLWVGRTWSACKREWRRGMGEEGGYFRASQRPWARRLSVFVIAMLLVGVFAVLVTAPTVSGATPPGPTPTVAPLRELTIGSEGLTIATTNPLQATLVDEYYLWTVVYSALINLGPSFEYEPDIAVRWQKVSDFPTTKFEFWIAKNAYWVDPALCTADATGRIISCPTTARTPVTANDVKFTYDYIFKNKNRTAYMGPCIDRLKVDAAGDPVGAVVIA